jgi:hypothetical protein
MLNTYGLHSDSFVGVKSADLLFINKDAKHSFRTILNSCSLLYFLLTNTIVFISSI